MYFVYELLSLAVSIVLTLLGPRFIPSSYVTQLLGFFHVNPPVCAFCQHTRRLSGQAVLT